MRILIYKYVHSAPYFNYNTEPYAHRQSHVSTKKRITDPVHSYVLSIDPLRGGTRKERNERSNILRQAKSV